MLCLICAEITFDNIAESIKKENHELKARLRDLEEKLKKLENRSWDNLGTGQRLNMVSSRRIIEDDDNLSENNEHGNEESTLVNNDPLFLNPLPSSNIGSLPQRRESTRNEKEKNKIKEK